MYHDRPQLAGRPGAVLDVLDPQHYQLRPGAPDGESSHTRIMAVMAELGDQCGATSSRTASLRTATHKPIRPAGPRTGAALLDIATAAYQLGPVASRDVSADSLGAALATRRWPTGIGQPPWTLRPPSPSGPAALSSTARHQGPVGRVKQSALQAVQCALLALAWRKLPHVLRPAALVVAQPGRSGPELLGRARGGNA